MGAAACENQSCRPGGARCTLDLLEGAAEELGHYQYGGTSRPHMAEFTRQGDSLAERTVAV
jgi:hypothetical protein